MNTAVINIKTDKNLKKQAQSIAYDLGLSLSSLINAYLKQLVRTRRVEFDLDEEPSERLIKSIKQAEKNWKEGKVSPPFDDVEKAIKWLDDPKAKYQNGTGVQR